MVPVGLCTEVFVNCWNQIIDEHLIERSAILAQTGLVASILIGTVRCFHVAALHHDDHRHCLTSGYQVVHDVLHLALMAPASLVLTHSMLQIEHRIAFLSLFIFCRRVDHCPTPLVRRVGIILE